MEQFVMKTKIHMGRSALQCLAEQPMQRVMIFCDNFLKTSGMIEKVETILTDRNMEYTVFSDINPDPDLYTVSCGIQSMLDAKADTLIAVGGGSVLDTAKTVRYMVEHQKPENGRISLIAVPTTSGTGSEMTSFAVITDEEKHVKYPMVSDEMLPDLALLDPELVLSVPASVTADTGMDVLTHAIESFVSVRHCDICDAFAEKATKIIFNYLEAAVRDGNDYTAREHVHNASCMAGIAFNSTSLGLCHAMAHALGAKFHIAHGRCNAMLLPRVILLNARKSPERYIDLSNTLGISQSHDAEAVYRLVNKIRHLEQKIGIVEKITETGITAGDYRDAIQEMTESALQDNCLKTNPCEVTADEIKSIFFKLI